jgi:hypothetical protein
MAEKKRTRAEIRAFRAEWKERNDRLLELAKKAQADLDRRKQSER